VTDKNNSTLGFGIFYWTINLGAFLFPLIIVPMLKAVAWHYVIIASAVGTGAMLIPTIFLFKEPNEPRPDKESFSVAFKGIAQKLWMVFTDWRFILFIFIYSWFWILYFQMFDSVLWYVKAFVDASPLDSWVQGTLGIDWHFDVEHVTVINAGTIILLQLFISKIVNRTKALPTMVTGIALGTIGMAILAFDTSIWVFMVGIIIFSIGEMTAYPKFISYLGLIAPPDKKATYMGFGFLYGAFGSLVGGILGAFLYVRFIDNPMIAYIKQTVADRGLDIAISSSITIEEALKIGDSIGMTKMDISQHAMTSELWLLFSGIGVLCIVGLLSYQKFIGTRSEH